MVAAGTSWGSIKSCPGICYAYTFTRVAKKNTPRPAASATIGTPSAERRRRFTSTPDSLKREGQQQQWTNSGSLWRPANQRLIDATPACPWVMDLAAISGIVTAGAGNTVEAADCQLVDGNSKPNTSARVHNTETVCGYSNAHRRRTHLLLQHRLAGATWPRRRLGNRATRRWNPVRSIVGAGNSAAGDPWEGDFRDGAAHGRCTSGILRACTVHGGSQKRRHCEPMPIDFSPALVDVARAACSSKREHSSSSGR